MATSYNAPPSVHSLAGDFDPSQFEDDVIDTEPKADYQSVSESEPVTNKPPIALGPGPEASSERPIALGPPSSASEGVAQQEGTVTKEVEQEGVVSVVLPAPESESDNHGSEEQLITKEQS